MNMNKLQKPLNDITARFDKVIEDLETVYANIDYVKSMCEMLATGLLPETNEDLEEDDGA